jgi:hypothetical protein
VNTGCSDEGAESDEGDEGELRCGELRCGDEGELRSGELRCGAEGDDSDEGDLEEGDLEEGNLEKGNCDEDKLRCGNGNLEEGDDLRCGDLRSDVSVPLFFSIFIFYKLYIKIFRSSKMLIQNSF